MPVKSGECVGIPVLPTRRGWESFSRQSPPAHELKVTPEVEPGSGRLGEG